MTSELPDGWWAEFPSGLDYEKVKTGLERLASAGYLLKAKPEVEAKPCPNGFHWIGQSWSCCDQCGLPVWEHAGMATPPEGNIRSMFDNRPLVLRPWEDGEREEIMRRWVSSG